MNHPKFSVGEKVMIYNEYNHAYPSNGEVRSIISREWEECFFIKCMYFGNIVEHRNCWSYETKRGIWVVEKNLRPIPKENKSTWESIEQLTGWNPVKQKQCA